MYKDKKIIGFIPARAGSKGIVKKNTHLLDGKPLICYTFEQAQKSRYLDDIVCSTDGKEIAELSQKAGIKVINRPPELASDNSPTIDAVLHAVNELKKQQKYYDYLLTLQPTSPLRKPEHIDGIIEECINNDFLGMLSVHAVKYNPVLVRFINNKQLTPILNTSSTVRRQDMQKACYVNGMLYICKTDILTTQFSLNDIPYGYEVDPQYSIDINDPEDINQCEKTLKNMRHK